MFSTTELFIAAAGKSFCMYCRLRSHMSAGETWQLFANSGYIDPEFLLLHVYKQPCSNDSQLFRAKKDSSKVKNSALAGSQSCASGPPLLNQRPGNKKRFDIVYNGKERSECTHQNPNCRITGEAANSLSSSASRF